MAGFCTHCGAPLEGDAKFCVECGASAVREKTKPVPAPQPLVMQQPAPRVVVQSDSSNKGVITLLLVIIVMLAVGGGYLYMENSQQPAAVAVTQHKVSAQAEKRDGTREYAAAAVAAFRENEESLTSLAAAINSGSYSQPSLLNMASNTMNKINARRTNAQQKSSSADASMAREINDMFDLEAKRAECMRQGIKGNMDQYRIGGEYYDQFQVRFEALKGRYSL